jgi:hypothetical protein
MVSAVSGFTLPNSFSVVPRAPDRVFIFCAPKLIFYSIEWAGSSSTFCAPRLVLGDTEDDMSIFHVLRFWTHFQRYKGCQFHFSCFTLPDSLWEVSRASNLVFMFCSSGLFLGSTEGIRSEF